MKVLVATTSRADWGLLVPVLTALRDDPFFEPKLAVTGQHLLAGETSLTEIAADGFAPDYEVDLGLTQDDRGLAASRAMASATAGFGSILAESKPDLLLLLGDRYELLGICGAAVVVGVPIVHLCGGDVTEGAFDDSFRHAVSKLASLHFVTNRMAARRLEAMGEMTSRVFEVGSTGLDRLRALELIAWPALAADLGLDPVEPMIMVCLHPETRSDQLETHLASLIEALDSLEGFSLLFTGSNADPGGRRIDGRFIDYAGSRKNAVFYPTLGSLRYLSAMKHAACLVGNSSSGLYEAPSLCTPTVNIGDRQKGRLKAASVVDCQPSADAIRAAIQQALDLDCMNVANPYGDGRAVPRIIGALKTITDPRSLIVKPFVERFAC